VRAGKEFVVRYLSPNTTNNPRKQLTAAEVAAYRAADLAICVVWETGTSRARAGRAAGQADATSAAAVAHSLGFPAGQPIYFAIDEDTTGAAVDAYFRGAADRIGVARVGAYGGIKPISYLFDHHLITFGWQTFAWSSGRWDPRAQAQQYRNDVTVAGVTVDLDRAMTSNYGQWEPYVPLTSSDAQLIWATPVQNNVTNTLVPARVFLTSMNTQINGLVAAMAGVAQTDAAILAAVTAATAATASGESIDTNTLVAHIKAVGDTESATVTALNQRLGAIGPAVTAAIVAALPQGSTLTPDQVAAIVNDAIERTDSAQPV